MRESVLTSQLMPLCPALPETLAAVDRFPHFEVILKYSKPCKRLWLQALIQAARASA
jgi:hypothetical protein